MKKKISLYIDGKLADLDNQSFILFNYSIEDLTNPAIVKNSFSQQITLNGTPRNNDIFGSLWKSDRYTATGSFDPMRRTPFAIYDETNDILESGYIKVDNVIRRKKRTEYKVTLYGGLGSFFYSLSYNENGTKKSLADLAFFGNDNPFNITINANTISEAWEALATGQGEGIWDVINFVPCYNGLPQGNFDAKKVWLKASGVPGVRENAYDDGATYYTKAGFTLLSFAEAFTEWEAGDLRSYLQRPVLSALELLNAIRDTRNNGGFKVTIDQTILDGEVKDAWITLPMIDNTAREGIDVTVNKQSLLGGMGSPAEWLLSLAKMLNWKFVFDNGNKAVSIVPNHKFYQDTLDDVSKMIDRSKEMSIVPLPMDNRWFTFGIPIDGEFAQKYRETYGIDFGALRVDTNYQFNAEEKEILEGIVAKGAVMAVETSKYYRTMNQDYTGNKYPSVLLAGSVNQTLWDTNGNAKEFACGSTTDLTDIEYNNGADFFAKVQLHNADNKAIDGSGVLLWYLGEQSGQGKRYHLTDDDNAMVTANNGVPCWKIDYSQSELQGIPQFSRYKMSGNEAVVSWDFSNPREIPIPNATIAEDAGIYARNWKKYISDRYDRETRTMTCKVKWNGRRVDHSLFRNFFWIDNSIWALNSIRNHSLTTHDATECTFIKVQDRENYLGYTPAPTPTPTPPEPTPGDLFIKVNGQTRIDYEAPYSTTRYAFTLEYTEGATIRHSTTQSWAYVASNETDIYIEGRSASDTGTRMATVTFTATKDGKEAKAVVNITQKAYERFGVLSMTPSGDQTVGKDATTLQFGFTTNPQGAVLMNATQSWVSWNSATNTLTINRNTSSQRSAIIEFYLQRYSYEGAVKQTFKLTQLASSATIYGITSVTPTSVDRDYQAAEVDFSFVSNPSSATIRAMLGSNAWLSWNASTKKMSIAENTSVDSRSATVTFYVDGHATDYQTKSVTITQGGRAYWGITSVTPTSLINESRAGSQVFSFVTSPSGYNVLADLGNADWLTYNANTKTLTWTENTTGEYRTANVTFYVEDHKSDWQTKVVQVKQKSSSIALLLDIPVKTGIAPYEGGDLDFEYVTNGTLRWDEPTNPRISVVSASDNIIKLRVTENPDITASDNVGSVRFYLQEDETKEATITLGQEEFAYYMSLNPLKITADASGGYYNAALNTNVPVDKIGRTIDGSGVGVSEITDNSARVYVQANRSTDRLDPKATIVFYYTDDPRVKATLTIAQRGSLPIENE